MQVADTLSRSYLQQSDLFQTPKSVPSVQSRTCPPHQKSTHRSRERRQKDVELAKLSSVILKGWTNNRDDVPPSLRQYWTYRDELTCLDGLLFKGEKLIMPQTIKSEMLEKIHETHLGTVKCKSRAGLVLFWPGMSSQIQEPVAACRVCAEHSRACLLYTSPSPRDIRTSRMPSSA